MDDEDARCLLDVICDPQALNDFLHGSQKIDSDDLLDSIGDAASAFLEDAGLHMQEHSGNLLSTGQSPPATSPDFDFLEEILGSPLGGRTNLENWDQPCDILQQSLLEANITEQMLKAEAELDPGPLQVPTLQPVVHMATNGTPQTCTGPYSSTLVNGQGQVVTVTPSPAPGQAPVALPPSTTDQFISSLTCSQGLSSASFSWPSSFSSSSSSAIAASSSILMPSPSRKRPLPQPPTPTHPTKLRVKDSGGSPSLTGDKAAPAPGSGDEGAFPSQSKRPSKTPDEAQRCIRLLLKVREEAGRIKVVHSTVVYPVYQRPARRHVKKGSSPTAQAPAGR